MSEIGPNAIWATPKVMKNTISVICVAAVEALRSAAIVGNAGKYMSMAKGPTATIRPRVMAFLRKSDFMTGSLPARASGPNRIAL